MYEWNGCIADANSDVQEVDVDEEGQEQNGIDDRMVISEISPIERVSRLMHCLEERDYLLFRNARVSKLEFKLCAKNRPGTF